MGKKTFKMINEWQRNERVSEGKRIKKVNKHVNEER